MGPAAVPLFNNSELLEQLDFRIYFFLDERGVFIDGFVPRLCVLRQHDLIDPVCPSFHGAVKSKFHSVDQSFSLTLRQFMLSLDASGPQRSANPESHPILSPPFLVFLRLARC